MICKCLEKRIELIPDEKLDEFKSPIELEYYLVESDTEDLEELSNEKVYGIEIVKKIDNTKLENKLVRNFSCCKESTRNVLNKLVNNTVTPLELMFILDDIIGA